MSIINPYITTNRLSLKILEDTFKEFIKNESKREGFNITIKKKEYIIDNKSFPLEWNIIKENSYDSSHMFLLEQFEKFRKTFVDSVVSLVIKEIETCDNTTDRFNKCTAVALGSSTITSDYDINLSSDNPIINSRIIKEFNEIFFKHFGKSSSVVFDTNIYGIGFLNKKKYIIPIENRLQTDMAFVKLIYIEKTYGLDVIKEFNLSNLSFIKLYESAKDFFEYYINGVDPENKYLEILQDIQNVLGIGNDLSITNSLSYKDQEKIQSLISLANMYANETYFSQGAFLHVVSNLQSGENLELSASDYVNSMLENFFELLKEYGIFTKSNELDINLYLKSSYKYLFRFYDASKEAGLSINNELYEVLSDLEKYRKNKDKISIRKLKKTQYKLDYLLFSPESPIGITPQNVGNDIFKYMNSFWEIIIPMFSQSMFIIPTPLRPSRRSTRSIRRYSSPERYRPSFGEPLHPSPRRKSSLKELSNITE
jgi:hypothetical protein